MFLDSESEAFRKSATKSALVSLQFSTCLTPVVWLLGNRSRTHLAQSRLRLRPRPRRTAKTPSVYCRSSSTTMGKWGEKNTFRLSSDKPTLWFQRLAKKQDYFCLKQCGESFWISGGWMDWKYAVWATRTGRYLVAGEVSLRFCCHEHVSSRIHKGNQSKPSSLKCWCVARTLLFSLITSNFSCDDCCYQNLIGSFLLWQDIFCSNQSTTSAVMYQGYHHFEDADLLKERAKFSSTSCPNLKQWD